MRDLDIMPEDARAAFNELEEARETLNWARGPYVDVAIQQVNLAEARIRALLQEKRGQVIQPAVRRGILQKLRLAATRLLMLGGVNVGTHTYRRTGA